MIGQRLLAIFSEFERTLARSLIPAKPEKRESSLGNAERVADELAPRRSEDGGDFESSVGDLVAVGAGDAFRTDRGALRATRQLVLANSDHADHRALGRAIRSYLRCRNNHIRDPFTYYYAGRPCTA